MTITNPERQIGPHPNVTIRHSRNALNLLMVGAVSEIESSEPRVENQHKFTRELVDALQEELEGWRGAAA